MSLSPEWETVLSSAGFVSIHWIRIGRASAADHEIFAFARQEGYAVFTHDLDFGTLLAFSRDHQPSVIQLRTQEVTPALVGRLVTSVLEQLRTPIREGARITIDPQRTRVRILPL